MDNVCEIDGNVIQTMCFKGTGVCCENCRKVRDARSNSGDSAIVEGDRSSSEDADPYPGDAQFQSRGDIQATFGYPATGTFD